MFLQGPVWWNFCLIFTKKQMCITSLFIERLIQISERTKVFDSYWSPALQIFIIIILNDLFGDFSLGRVNLTLEPKSARFFNCPFFFVFWVKIPKFWRKRHLMVLFKAMYLGSKLHLWLLRYKQCSLRPRER